MTESINVFVILFFTFLAGMFFIVTRFELKRGEILIKTCFAAGVYCMIFAGLHLALECKFIDMTLLITLVIIEFIIYITITLYALIRVKSTEIYEWE